MRVYRSLPKSITIEIVLSGSAGRSDNGERDHGLPLTSR